jgi:hypothetical protein
MRKLSERVRKLELATKEAQYRELDAIFATKSIPELEFFSKHGYFPGAEEETDEVQS